MAEIYRFTLLCIYLFIVLRQQRRYVHLIVILWTNICTGDLFSLSDCLCPDQPQLSQFNPPSKGTCIPAVTTLFPLFSIYCPDRTALFTVPERNPLQLYRSKEADSATVDSWYTLIPMLVPGIIIIIILLRGGRNSIGK